MRFTMYRLGIRTGLNSVRRLRASTPTGPFFFQPTTNLDTEISIDNIAPSPIVLPKLFGWLNPQINEGVPLWHTNAVNGKTSSYAKTPWWLIPDFDSHFGDIKTAWELSRFDWVFELAILHTQGNDRALAQLESWLHNWCHSNVPYRGLNWKCGQEASIRVIHLTITALVLDQANRPTQGLLDLIRIHLQRISPTIMYAVAQNNNHGTSEAAALYIGGSLLARHGVHKGSYWQDLGRKWLEDRVAHLIGDEGTFSQYSLTYHRLMLDTLSLVEIWRKHLSDHHFSAQYHTKAKAATNWLFHMIDHITGDGPNVGANDGARLIRLSMIPERDFRPSVQLASVLFNKMSAFSDSDSNTLTDLFNLPKFQKNITLSKQFIADDGGFSVLRNDTAMLMLRYPVFKFRPSQADALHADLWIRGENILRDAGSYSYNMGTEWIDYFTGTESHNTIRCDDRDQMPRISRFLFADWLESHSDVEIKKREATTVRASYSDSNAFTHEREVSLYDSSLVIRDRAINSKEKCVLQWRLIPDNWLILDSQECSVCIESEFRGIVLTVQTEEPFKNFQLNNGWESCQYRKKTPLPVLEVEAMTDTTFTTTVEWAP